MEMQRNGKITGGSTVHVDLTDVTKTWQLLIKKTSVLLISQEDFCSTADADPSVHPSSLHVILFC